MQVKNLFTSDSKKTPESCWSGSEKKAGAASIILLVVAAFALLMAGVWNMPNSLAIDYVPFALYVAAGAAGCAILVYAPFMPGALARVCAS
jgi:hypothetical protein